MNLEFHPNAAEVFNSQADALLNDLVEFPVAGKRFTPERHLTNVPPDYEKFMNIKLVAWEAKLVNGETILLLFDTRNGAVGLTPDDYEELKQFSAKLSRASFLKQFVSAKKTREALTDWLTQRKKGEISTNLCEYLALHFASEIQERELWIPLEATYIESELEVGDVTIRSVTEVMCEAWWQKRSRWVLEHTPDTFLDEQGMFEQFRKAVQGYAACVVKVVAEPDRAREIAYEKAHVAANFLCCFSPAGLDPSAYCHTLPLGHGNVRKFTYFTVEDSQMHNLPSGIEDLSEWFIDAEQIQSMKEMGLARVDEILRKKTKSRFEEQLLSVLQLYGKSSTSMTMGDKLLYIVTALESLLVKDSNEALTQNVSERLAFAVAATGTQRQEVIINYRDTYALRSKFVHHGQEVEDEGKVRLFMQNARAFFQITIDRSGEFTTKDEFIRAIEKVKYEGGAF